MTLTLKPVGRGKWSALRVELAASRRVSPLLIRAGQRLVLGGVTWRI